MKWRIFYMGTWTGQSSAWRITPHASVVRAYTKSGAGSMDVKTNDGGSGVIYAGDGGAEGRYLDRVALSCLVNCSLDPGCQEMHVLRDPYVGYVCKQADCPSDWSSYSGRCYRILPKASWDGGFASCKNLGAHIAVVTEYLQNTFLHDMWMSSAEGTSNGLWLGVTDHKEEGTWRWVTNEQLSFDMFGKNERNGGTRENCAAMIAADGLWMDEPCKKTYPVLCENIL
ncbi:echinoidin-like isoform X2 [Mya arenaria]|uniref:echinoidin-like isoform X2 n=1 Tax=Mya arenaria TaxID=6604 RepID=UPI0022E5E969|nr:echinoidin-like isoform X2 [Mya arenaria]XP_052811920.1 echinoidin-like isoform X2 [Mya arenaria]